MATSTTTAATSAQSPAPATFVSKSGTSAIGTLVATVTVREDGRDELTVTENPVETGAAITDHAFKRPAEVTIEAGWDGTNDPAQIYQQLLALQASRVPFDVYTLKRAYQNMLISSLSVSTDEKTSNVLMVTVRCKQILIVSTSSIPVPSNPAVHADPSKTAPIQSKGPQQLQPANINASSLPGAEVGLAGPSGLG